MRPSEPEREPADETLTDERKLQINRYIASALGLVEDMPEGPPPEEATPPQHHPPLHAVPEPGPEPELPEAVEPTAEVRAEVPVDYEAPTRRRGRPRGARKRRQVHFHVDPDEDRLLLRAAGHFGSQQKALIAALHALTEVLALRTEVEALKAECQQQRRLLAEAQALFKSR